MNNKKASNDGSSASSTNTSINVSDNKLFQKLTEEERWEAIIFIKEVSEKLRLSYEPFTSAAVFFS